MSFTTFTLKRKLDDPCPICLDEFELDTSIVLTNCCNAHFHQLCLKDVKNCPNCRAPFAVKEDKLGLTDQAIKDFEKEVKSILIKFPTYSMKPFMK